MKGAWFVVTCEVENGNATNKINRVVYALTISQAKYKAKAEFSSGPVKILYARKLIAEGSAVE